MGVCGQRNAWCRYSKKPAPPASGCNVGLGAGTCRNLFRATHKKSAITLTRTNGDFVAIADAGVASADLC